MTVFASFLRRACSSIFQIRPVRKVWEWIDQHVAIPVIVGSVNPGPLDTSLLPFWRGIYDLYWRRKTRFITIMASARVGKTLFAICCVLHKIAIWPGPILWLDPTRKTAMRFSRGELQPHIAECPPCDQLANRTVKTWTTLEMQFVNNVSLGLIGSGSAAESAGRQGELLVINESDKAKHDIKAEAPIHDLFIVRSKQFFRTRKVIEESTPTDSRGRIASRFKLGSQHHVYVPCPHCRALSRITFFPEEKEVPWPAENPRFDADGFPVAAGETSIEKTICVKFHHLKTDERADYDLERIERETCYHCPHCDHNIPRQKLNWMLQHYQLRAHNPKAPPDHLSVHVWAGLSPFESIGELAKKFLQARGSIARMHDFWNSDLGLPFIRHATEIKDDDIDVVIRRSPEYVLRQLPRLPVILTMTVDVQGECFWWSIRAWGLIADHTDAPVWSALIDYGSAVSWDQIEEIAGLAPDRHGQFNEYTFTDPSQADHSTAFRVAATLIDSGYEAQRNKKVYEFCLKWRDHGVSPSKGGGWQQLRGMTLRTAPVYDDQLELVWYEDAAFKQQLYYHCIKEAKEHWWLPRDIARDYRAQLTAEHTKEVEQSNGERKLEWEVTGEQGNHLGDTEKMHEALRELISARLQTEREKILAARKTAPNDPDPAP